jgi:hypothetical protein
MPSAHAKKICAVPITYCSAPCPGHGSSQLCPPLIVIAVLSAQQTMWNNGGSR